MVRQEVLPTVGRTLVLMSTASTKAMTEPRQPAGGKLLVLELQVDPRPRFSTLAASAGHVPADVPLDVIENLLPPYRELPTLRRVYAVNFGVFRSSERMLRWGTALGLEPSHPRICLSIGNCGPTLYEKLGPDPFGLVSLVPFTLSKSKEHKVCALWFHNEEKHDVRLEFFHYGWSPCYWIGFEKKGAVHARNTPISARTVLSLPSPESVWHM